ncbi:MAG TPA: hypothetical protein VL346_11115 [Acidobacteriaceae bacterium]|nr:hypothetical protein [Acidobacteriaceae bacterium]
MEYKDRQETIREEKLERDEMELTEFERELRQAMQRKAAPLGLKQRVLAQARERRRAGRGRMWMLQRVTASAVLAVVVGGFAVYHESERRAEEQRKGEEARQQVLTALRITNKTLTRVSDRLTDSDR